MIDTFTASGAAATDAVGSFLLDTILKGTVLSILACVAATLLRRASAAVRHRVWCLAFLGLLLLPALLVALPAWRVPIVPGLAAAPGASGDHPAVEAPALSPRREDAVRMDESRDPADVVWTQGHSNASSAALEHRDGDFATPVKPELQEAADSTSRAASAGTAARTPAINWQAAILIVWLIGFAWVLLPVAASPIHNRIVISKARTVMDPERHRLFAELCRSLHVRRPIRLVEVDRPLVPMTWGLLRPIVVLPAAWREWTVQRQRIVLLHELAHVKRWDMQFQLLARMACAVYWFHPLVWYSLRRLRVEREMACDDCVLMAGERPTEYASHLLELARDCRALAIPTALAMSQPTSLECRVRALLDEAHSHLPLSRAGARLILACAAVLLVAVAMVGLADTSEPRVEAIFASAETPPGAIELLAQQPLVSLSGHTAGVWAVALASDGRSLVSAARDGSVKVWNLPGATERVTLKVFEEPSGPDDKRRELYCAALASDERTLAAAGTDAEIRLWDLSTAKKLRTIVGHQGAVLALAFSPDGKNLVSTGMDTVVRVWDVATGEAVHDGFRGNAFRNDSLAFSPDGQTILSGCRGNSVKLWQMRPHKYLASLPPDGAPLAIACSPDDQSLAIGADHGHITLWKRTAEGKMQRRVLEGHRGDVTAVAFTPNGRILASSGVDGMLRLWDMKTDSEKSRIVAHAGGARCLAISADGRFLASGGEDHTVKVWDIGKLKEATPAKTSAPLIQEPVRPLRPARLESLATSKTKRLGGVFLAKGSGASWSPDAMRLAFGKSPPEDGIAILDLKAGRQSTLVDIGRDPAWSPKEENLVAYVRGGRGEEELWVADASGGEPRRITEGTFPAWSPDGKTLYFVSRDETLEAMPWPADGDTSAPKTIARDVGEHPAVSPNGKQVAFFNPKGFLSVLDCQSGKVSVVGGLCGGPKGFAAWSPDGRQLACDGASNDWLDLGLWIVDPAGLPPMSVIRGGVTRPVWSPDGAKLAFDFTLTEGSEIWMLETRSLAPLRTLHAAHHPRGAPAHLDLETPFSPKGKLIPLELDERQAPRLPLSALGNPLNDLPGLPRGEQVLAGVKFKIGDRPIQLGNEYLPMAPDKVEGIPVHRAVARLYVLHGNGVADPYTGFPNRAAIADYRPRPFRSGAIDGVIDGTTIGYYRIRYEDGGDQWIAFAEGEDVRDWCSWFPVAPTRGTVAWKTFNEVTADRAQATGREPEPFCLFVGGWENPHPERKVAAIDYISAGTSAAPFCAAVTIEEPSPR